LKQQILPKSSCGFADSVRENPKEYRHLQEELADVFWFICRICEHFDVALSKAVEEKTV
jgi:NTP pyrophosphatase (non-canonical NTP hydrolase)